MRYALVFATLLAAAQAWEPFTARREVSERGRHYAVLVPSRDGSEVRFSLSRRREGAGPIAPVRDLPITAPASMPRPDLSRDPADPLLAEGILPQPPYQVRVLDGTPGIVLFERYGALGRGDALSLVGAEGKALWRRALSDLFPAEAVAAFPREGSDLWWWQAWWVDEARGQVVVAAAGDLFREVALADGAVREASSAVLLTRVLEGPAEDRADALELAARLLPEGIDGPARKAAEDGSAPLAVRVRAALALHRRKSDFPAGPLFREALARGNPPAARAYAARWIGEVLGKEALPPLRDAMRGEADEAWRPALEAMAGLGATAVPTLLEMLGEKDQHLDYRGGAAHVLGILKAPEALPGLWKAALDFDPTKDEFHFVPGAALDAILAIEPPHLRWRLVALLDKGGPHDGRIAQWIEAHPGKNALPALVAALERSARFSWERKRIIAALQACTGKDHGEDVEKWRQEQREYEKDEDEKRARWTEDLAREAPRDAPRTGSVASALLEAESTDLPRTAVVPHPRAPMPPGKNVLWCATFQLAWDAMADDVAKGPFELGAPTPPGLIEEMNRRSFPHDALDPACFLARAGLVRDGILDSIRKELRDRFDAAMLDPGVLPPDGAVAYGYLRKSLPFEHRFEPVVGALSFNGGDRKVIAFGANEDSTNPDLPAALRQVTVFEEKDPSGHRRPTEFTLGIDVRGGKDRFVLAMVPPAATLEETWRKVRERLVSSAGRRLKGREVLAIPKLNFRLDHRFQEVIGAPVLKGPTTDRPVSEARQTVRFSLDEGGADLESHALLTTFGAHPTYRVDRPFLLALLETGKEHPYLLLWIDNDELLAEAAK